MIRDNKKNKTLCFVAGKSGGHIVPCITLARQAKKKQTKEKQEKEDCFRILFFSTTSLLDRRILENNEHIDMHVPLPLESLLLNTVYGKARTAWFFLISFLSSMRELYKYKPYKVVSTGGHIAIPVCLAARFLRIPIELYELNVQPGKAISLLSVHASKVFICFNKTALLLPKVVCTAADYPIRFTDLDRGKSNDVSAIGLDPAKKTIFILGGSQGSFFLNKVMEQVFVKDSALGAKVNVIHQTGEVDQGYWRQFYQDRGIPALIFSYSHILSVYYQAADLIVSRAGAGALFEILFFNKQALLIPLEIVSNNRLSNNHQYDNAHEMVIKHQRLFRMVRQQEIDKDIQVLINAIKCFLKY